MQQGSSGNQNKANANSGNLMSIDDLLGGPVTNNPVAANTQNNASKNTNSVFDSNMFWPPVTNSSASNSNNLNGNNSNNNVIDFGFIVNNNNANQAHNSNSNANATTDLFNVGSTANTQSNVNQASKPAGGFNTDDLLKSNLIAFKVK